MVMAATDPMIADVRRGMLDVVAEFGPVLGTASKERVNTVKVVLDLGERVSVPAIVEFVSVLGERMELVDVLVVVNMVEVADVDVSVFTTK